MTVPGSTITFSSLRSGYCGGSSYRLLHIFVSTSIAGYIRDVSGKFVFYSIAVNSYSLRIHFPYRSKLHLNNAFLEWLHHLFDHWFSLVHDRFLFGHFVVLPDSRQAKVVKISFSILALCMIIGLFGKKKPQIEQNSLVPMMFQILPKASINNNP